jgi:hypothetical protein
MPYRTCKRCSVTRVNILCELYEQAFQENGDKAKQDLAKLVALAADRGYWQGRDMMNPGLDESKVRSFCWNISSLLKDEDLERLGYRIGKK